ncbi:MAG: hypothetical protein LBT59_08255 [Clostridiales bacterium]|jgi:hypothetical protein|nr:hypothetical protein [Clostridiales bacterium]
MKNADNYEEHTRMDLCEKALALYESDRVANLLRVDDLAWSAEVNARDGCYKTEVRFETNTGRVISNCSFCHCLTVNCEHKLAVVMAIKDKYYLGAQAAPEPPKLFRARGTKALDDAVALYLKSSYASPFELAKSAISSKNSVDIALNFSIFMKKAVKAKRKLYMHDINTVTGIMAISVMGIKAFEKKSLYPAAVLQSIALDALDSMQCLAWRNKDFAKDEKPVVLKRLEQIVNEADAVAGMRMIDVFADVIRQARYEDTILGTARIALKFCHEKRARDRILDILESRNIMLESEEMKEVKVAIAICDKTSSLDDYFEKHKSDSFYQFKYVDYLADKGKFEKALEICESGEACNGWAEKQCEVLEMKGDRQGLRKAREHIAFDLEVSDDTFFKNFNEMKSLYTSEEWKYIEAGLVREMKGTKFSYATCGPRYVRYLKQIGNADDLYMICFYQPELFDDLFDTLSNAYLKQLPPLFEKYMLWKAQFDGNEARYKEICSLLEKYRAKGLDISSAISKLIERHSRRKSLVRALSELNLVPEDDNKDNKENKENQDNEEKREIVS